MKLTIRCEGCDRVVEMPIETAVQRVVQKKVTCMGCGSPLLFPEEAEVHLGPKTRVGNQPGTIAYAKPIAHEVQKRIAGHRHQERREEMKRASGLNTDVSYLFRSTPWLVGVGVVATGLIASGIGLYAAAIDGGHRGAGKLSAILIGAGFSLVGWIVKQRSL
jgi:hypothetical protein